LNPHDMWLINILMEPIRQKYIAMMALLYLNCSSLTRLNLPNPFDVYSIYKDRKGNIWFGTNPVGVCRYDGKSFEWITEEDVTEFRNEGANGVRSITEDKNGDFWFNTENRYSVYDSIDVKKQ
jgi:ligand-binding sensor domain-containing protein